MERSRCFAESGANGSARRGLIYRTNSFRDALHDTSEWEFIERFIPGKQTALRTTMYRKVGLHDRYLSIIAVCCLMERSVGSSFIDPPNEHSLAFAALREITPLLISLEP
jgi:hypothetical protein